MKQNYKFGIVVTNGKLCHDKMDKGRITVILPAELEEKVIRLAEKEERSKSAMTAILIKEALQERDRLEKIKDWQAVIK